MNYLIFKNEIMKKVMYLICFMFFGGIQGFATVGLPNQISSAAGGGTYDYYLDSDCQYTATFLVQLTNLDVLNGIECSSNLIAAPLPEGYLPMKLWFQINDKIEIVEPSVFIKESCGENGEPSVFYYYHVMSYDFSDFCENLDNPNLVNPVTLTSKIITYEGSVDNPPANPEIYPICSHLAQGDIFDCTYFEETEPYCENNPPVCVNEDLGDWSKSTIFKCGYACSGGVIPGGEEPGPGGAGGRPQDRLDVASDAAGDEYHHARLWRAVGRDALCQRLNN